MATDMMPIPALAALVIHTIWIIVFIPLVGAYHVFDTDQACHSPGVNYQAIIGGFIAIYVLSWFFELALFIIGCRGAYLEGVLPAASCISTCTVLAVLHSHLSRVAGTPLEVQKRKAVIPLLYVMSFIWLCQLLFAGKQQNSC